MLNNIYAIDQNANVYSDLSNKYCLNQSFKQHGEAANKSQGGDGGFCRFTDLHLDIHRVTAMEKLQRNPKGTYPVRTKQEERDVNVFKDTEPRTNMISLDTIYISGYIDYIRNLHSKKAEG